MADQFPALDDFNDFSGAPASGGGSQSDFLARERELLGDEFGPTPAGLPNASDFSEKAATSSGSGFPSLDDDILSGGSPAPAAPAAYNQQSRMSNDFLSSFERDPPAKQTSVAVDNDEDEDDDLNKFQNQYPDIAPYQPVSHATPQPPQQQQQNGYSDSTYGQTSSYAAPSEPESDAIREWREKQSEEIARSDERSSERKEEIIRKAEKAIDDFYANYNSKKERTIAKNKEDEAAFVRTRDDALGKGTTWERIAEMIELQDSRSKTVTKGTKDLSRFKEVLLSLKREGDSAPNAAGY